ncbi:hypothetical protein T492DRAFT_870384 [Pavlovales sp. CCMP2436]|nr:hypothetical protein T492DRAFT_870384 [Pavlovales sp. CCMP2436]
MSYTVLRPYARKFANVYAQVVDVAAVKTDELEAWTVEIYDSLLARGPAMFEMPATFTGAVYLPALTYLGSSLLVEPAVNITGCTASSDSWLVQTDNTGSNFQVLAEAAYDPAVMANAVCKASPRFTGLSTVDQSDTVWPRANWVVSASSNASGSTALGAFDKSETKWTCAGGTFGTNGNGTAWVQIQYPQVTTINTEPASLSTFKLALTDTDGLPVSTTALAVDCDVNLCLLKNNKIASSGLYRFAAEGGAGVLDKLSVAEVPGLRTYEPSADDFERAKTAITSRFSNGRL